MRTYLRLFSLLVLLLAGCAPQQKHVLKDRTFVHPLPAVFRADLDLKRCPSTSFELVLRPDGMYFLQMERMARNASGRKVTQAEIGVWRYSEAKKLLRLTSYDKASRILAVTGQQTLKLIKVSGGMMPSLVRYDFTLTHTEPRYEGIVRMQGMYTRKRGRGVFRECLSGARFPLVTRGRAAEVEQAYQDILHGRAESLFVTLDIRLSSQAGRGDRLIAVRSVHIDPYHFCKGKGRRIATILNNRWYLTEIGGESLEPESVSKPPFLKVQGGEQLIQGFAGCNNFSGSWLFADNDFVFSRIASTRMACPVGMEVEDAFLQALDTTRRYTISGDILSLYDRQGRVLARLRYSRQLTDLDFRYVSSEQEEKEGDLLADDIDEALGRHSVETGGAVPASVVSPPVREVDEKILPLPEEPEESGHENSALHEIRVLKAKKKVAVSKTEQATPQRSETKAMAPATTSRAVVEKKEQEVQDEPQSTESTGDGESVTASYETSQPEIQGRAEKDPAPVVPSIPASEVTGQKFQPESLTTGNGENASVSEAEAGEKLPAGEAVAQAEMQTSEEKEGAPSLPAIPEADQPAVIEKGDKVTTAEVTPPLEKNVSSDEMSPLASQAEETEEVETSLPVAPSSAEDGEEKVQPSDAGEGQGAVQVQPISESISESVRESSCNQPWKTPLTEISGQIRKVAIKSPPWTKQSGLHLDVETSSGSYVIHVFPENLIKQCREVFHFEVGETVTVSGSEFRSGKGQGQLNICAATITRATNVLQLRDPLTSGLDKRVCCQEYCGNKCTDRPEKCMSQCLSQCNKIE
ncbi:MAG: META domain-containing protein [Candidatus Electrothrix sp. GW3-4]|uniref:META domain-containing protein n=1 Tax=Candidatus Electrothrix sp. GW3-4 TaxID=3126740 RepID=UPI0030CC63FC